MYITGKISIEKVTFLWRFRSLGKQTPEYKKKHQEQKKSSRHERGQAESADKHAEGLGSNTNTGDEKLR